MSRVLQFKGGIALKKDEITVESRISFGRINVVQYLVRLAIVALCVALVACSDAQDVVPVVPQPAPTVVETVVAPEPPTAEPQATSEPLPTATVIPTSSPTVVAEATPHAPENAAVAQLSAKGIQLLTQFTEEYSPRESGTDGERAAAEFIGKHLEDLGYRVEYQQFDVEHIPWGEDFVSILGEGMPELRAVPLAQTGLGDVTAPLISAGRAFEDEIPANGMEGSIALIERGEITFEEKVNRVADAGAVAAIIYNNERGNFRGALQSDGPIPAASLSREAGEQLLGLLEDEPELEARVKIEMVLLNSQNVIAELDNQPAECGVLIMGAHYDSVADTQAAGDNGTGVVSLLIMAEELANARFNDDQPLPYAVRLVFFGVEEIGLYGSRHYVDNLSDGERERVIAMLNFDAMGKGDASVVGSADLVDRALEYAEVNGIELNGSNEPAGFGSDHAPFLAVDIPALFFFGNDFSIINSPEDVLDLVEPEIMGANMAVGLGLLEGFECKS